MYAYGVFVVVERPVEVVEVIAFLGLYIYGIARGYFVALVCKGCDYDGAVVGGIGIRTCVV